MVQPLLRFFAEIGERDRPVSLVTNLIFSGQEQSLFLQKFVQFFVAQRDGKAIFLEKGDVTKFHLLLSGINIFSSQIYIIRNITKEDTDIIEYLRLYHGSHRVIITSNCGLFAENNIHVRMVNVPAVITGEGYQKLMQFFHGMQPLETFVKKLFFLRNNFSLDEACMLMDYQELLGKNETIFFEHWFHRLTTQSQSLFQLSTVLFSGHADKFYKEWKSWREKYHQEFWISYWSELLWQATIFIQYANMVNTIEAKKKVNRLPFVFMNGLWKKYSTDQLLKAHDLLYRIDYQEKHGAIIDKFDIFFALFFESNWE